MHIDLVRIVNFRCFADATIPLNRYTSFVGANGAGKSTVLSALNVFFKEAGSSSLDVINLSPDDFHNRNILSPIRITVHFSNLSSSAQEDFKGYYRNGKLVVTCEAMLAEGTSVANTKYYGERLVFSEFKDFFRAQGDGAKVEQLKALYADFRSKFELPAETVGYKMTAALRKYEEERPSECTLEPSEDQFYGATKGAGRLNKHIQWVYVPAVKDATSEEFETRAGSLGKLLARQVRTKVKFDEAVASLRSDLLNRYKEMLNGSQAALADLSASLQSRLQEFSHPEAKLVLKWRDDDERSIKLEEPIAHILAGEGEFMGGLARFGHGLQRSYLLALLHELASSNNSEDGEPTLLLGCEEPELYQHPPQARHLGGVMRKISEGNAQVLITTHSPHFVAGDGFHDVRLVRRHAVHKCSRVAHVAFQDLAEDIGKLTGKVHIKAKGIRAKIHQALQPNLNEMFFTSKLILVEGLEDVAYLTSVIALEGRYEEFRRQGCHIVHTDGKSKLLQPLCIAKRLCIPTFFLFDADGDKEDKKGSRAVHQKDNSRLLEFAGCDHIDAFPSEVIFEQGLCVWDTDIGEVAQREIGLANWSKYRAVADAECGHVGDMEKHALHIGSVLASAWEDHNVPPSLQKVCTTILDSVLG